MAEVSRNVVAILLVLVIAVSGLGTYSLLQREHTTQSNGYANVGDSAGNVQLNIGTAPPEANLRLQVVPGANNG